jgi:erythromycin esterase-like protein
MSGEARGYSGFVTRKILFFVHSTALGLLAGATPVAQDEAEVAVVEWLRAKAVPLQTVEAGNGFKDMQALKAVVGDARIVALGESTHGTREVFQMKHRMLEFLVEAMGFTLFGIEASFPDCVAINDYVLHGRGDPGVALHGQGFWTWDTEAVLEMIEWMRRYNADPAHERKLEFYGFDMQVSVPALAVALPYVERFEPKQAGELRQRLELLLNPLSPQAYGALPNTTRDALQQAVADLVVIFDRDRDRMIEQSSNEEWAMARQHAVVARQFEEMLRTMSQTIPAVGRLLAYLDHYDFEFAESVRVFLGELSEAGAGPVNRYRLQLSDADRERWQAIAKSLGERLDAMRVEYVGRSSQDEWRQARHLAREVEQFVGMCDELNEMPPPDRMLNVRDRCMAENVAWILEHEGPQSKIVAWAHNGHVSHSPAAPGTGSMGAELARRFGDDLVVFGFAFDKGGFQAIYRPLDGQWDGGPGLRPFNVGPAQPGSVDRVFSGAGLPLFVIDLRLAPESGPVADWLAAPHLMRAIGAVFSPDGESNFYNHLVVPQAYDAIIFLESTTAARPTRLTRKKFGLEEKN